MHRKSQLAIEYAQEVRQQSPQTWVFWIHASSASRFDQSIRKITDRLKIPGRQDANADQLQLLQSWLQDEENGKWLVILDNVDDASFLLEPLPTTDTVRRWDHFPPDRHGSMMITSRSKLEALKLVYAEEIIPVTTMSEVEAVALMQRKLGNRDEGINELVRALDCLPLAVTQAASFIRLSGSRYTVHKYREEFELSLESRSSLLESKVPIPNRDKEASNSVFLTWQISFDHVRKIRQSAADLLALMSFCDRSAIPEILIRAQREENAASSGKAKLLCSGGEDVSPARVGMSLSSSDAGDKASSPLDGEKAASGKGEKISLDKRNNVPSSREDQDTPNGRNLTYTDRAIETASENKTSSDNAIEAAPDDVCTSLACNAITFEEDIVMLRSYSFTDETIDSQTWEMHRLVQDATQAWLEAQGSIDDFYGHFLGRFLRSLPKCKIETWPVYRILFPHARRAFVRQPRRRKASLHWASVMHDVARFAVNIGDYSTGEEMAAASVTVRLAHLGNEHKETLWTMATLADTYRVRGRLNEAEQLWVKILQVSEALFNQDPSEILPDLCRYSLSTVYEGQGRFSEAEQLQLQILKSKSELNSAGPPGSLLTLSNLETVHNDPGQYAKAEQPELLVLETTKILAAEDSDTLQLMTRLALTYMYQGRRTEAEQLSLKVLEAKKKVHGVEHSQTLQSMAVLAMVYTVQGRHAEAEHLTLEALEITKRVLGAGHTDTLDLMSHLARIYTDQGRHSEAEQQQLQSLQIQSAVLGEEHPATLTSMHNLANRYHYLKRWQEAEHLEVKVLEGRTVAFGSEHPLTLDSMCSLALAYMMQERLIEAEDLQVKCLETRTAVLGADHQDTLNSAFSLGAVYARQKRFAEALRLTERAAEGYNKVCGMQDNRTVTAMFLLKRLRLRLEQQQRDSVASATSSAIEEGPGIDTEAPVQFARSQQVEDTISAHGESNTLGDQSKGRALWTGMKRLFGKAPKR
jgi:tetratricopeptide (TPR) repeat protein